MSHFRNTSNFIENFWENSTQAFVIRKDSSFSRMTEQIQILQRRLECFSRDLKVF